MNGLSVGDALALGAALVTLGVQLATVASLKESVRRLERGAGEQGRRVGDLETALALVDQATGAHVLTPRVRRPTSSFAPLSAAADESGEHTKG